MNFGANHPSQGTTATNAHSHRRLGNGFVALAGMLGMQMFIGYEWFMSGLTKVIRGGFVSGFGDALGEGEAAAPACTADFSVTQSRRTPTCVPPS